jgi:hypothetical protein
MVKYPYTSLIIPAHFPKFTFAWIIIPRFCSASGQHSAVPVFVLDHLPRGIQRIVDAEFSHPTTCLAALSGFFPGLSPPLSSPDRSEGRFFSFRPASVPSPFPNLAGWPFAVLSLIGSRFASVKANPGST